MQKTNEAGYVSISQIRNRGSASLISEFESESKKFIPV
jgi:hypothetical protein